MELKEGASGGFLAWMYIHALSTREREIKNKQRGRVYFQQASCSSVVSIIVRLSRDAKNVWLGAGTHFPENLGALIVRPIPCAEFLNAYS